MRTAERLKAIRSWFYENLCRGRQMKTPAYGDDGFSIDITKIATKEPIISLAWEPSRNDGTYALSEQTMNIVPGIVIMPATSYAKKVEEQRFDRYKNVERSKGMAQELVVDILFKVYEPGIRLPGFTDSADSEAGLDMSLLKEGSEEGLFTLTEWIDDCLDMLECEANVPGTDLYVSDANVQYSLYMDENYVVDKRPIYYGFIRAKFIGYADRKVNHAIEDLL